MPLINDLKIGISLAESGAAWQFTHFQAHDATKHFSDHPGEMMSVAPIKAFAEKARADAGLSEKLKACLKIKELRALALDHGFEIQEDSLYPPNEPQFTEDQLSERLCKALLRV